MRNSRKPKNYKFFRGGYAFGLKYFKIDNNETADELLKEVLFCNESCICEAVVNPEQGFEPKSSSKVLPDGRIVSSSLDDVASFLERKEFEK